MIRNSIRLGLFRDRPVFDEARTRYDSVVVPAHLAAHSPDGMWGFLKGIQEPRFFYDPMTYWFLLGPRFWTRGSEEAKGLDVTMPVEADEIRPAFRRLIEEYGLLEAVTTMTAEQFAGALPELLSRSVIDFQRRGIHAKTDKAAKKYASILGRPINEAGFSPERIVAPYVALDDGESLTTQARLNTRAMETQPAEDLWGVVAFSTPGSMRQLGDVAIYLGLDRFAGVGLWVGGLDEHTVSVQTLARYRQVIRSIPAPVWLMYAGYFGILASFDGVHEISHGVFYTESKKLVGPVGSGPPADRYYIQALHRFYEPVRALTIIRAVPEFACECDDCRPIDDLMDAAINVRPGSPVRGEWVARLQRHFLSCRASEVEVASRMTLTDAVRDMRNAAERVEALPRQVQQSLGLSDNHLNRWVSAISKPI